MRKTVKKKKNKNKIEEGIKKAFYEYVKEIPQGFISYNRYLTIIAEKIATVYRIKDVLEVIGLSVSTYYYQKKRMQEGDRDAKLKEIISDIFFQNNCVFGYRRITHELRERRIFVNFKKVYRVMKAMGIKGRPRGRVKKYIP